MNHLPITPVRAALAALAAALLLAPSLAAQDVLQVGRVHGTAPPAWVTEALREQPDAFEFRRAWRNRVAQVRQERRRLEAGQAGPLLSTADLQAAGAAVTGTMRVPVIAARYAGRAAPFPVTAYQERLFGEGGASYTAKSLYREMSRGAFTLDGTVTGWIPLPEPASYYEPSAGTDPRYGRTGDFLRHALTGADPTVNFAEFDNDGADGVPNSGDDDGYVDAAAFIYPAHGKSCGGPGIWPHRWAYSAYGAGPFVTDDPSAEGGTIRVDDYLIQGGLECDGTSLMQIGTFSHEMGHALALPDLYDTQGTTEGLGDWDLMAGGNWRTQASPAHMGAWSKDFLGWVSVERVAGTYPALTLAPVYEAGRVLRYDIPGTREYFLLEHRRVFGSEASLHGPGLLVYHVDDVVVESTLRSNRVNAGPRHGVDLEEADGLDNLVNGANRGDAGDPFPGSAARTAFGDAGYPNSRSNGGVGSGFELRGVQYTAGRLTLDLVAGAPPAPVATVSVSPSTASVVEGATLQLTATPRDAAGNALTGRAVTWTTSSAALATVSATGLVRSVAAGGPVTITATAEGRSGAATLTVTPVTGTVLTSGVAVGGLSGALNGNQLFRIVVPAGAARLDVTLSGGTGDADLYVRRGTPPTVSTYDCGSNGVTNAEECRVSSPAAGDWFINLNAYAAYAGATLRATVVLPGAGLALGDSADGVIATAGATTTTLITLAAGDVVDLGAFPLAGQPGFAPYLELYSPSGTLLAPASVARSAGAWILPRFTVPATGVYGMRVRDQRTGADRDRNTGAYRLRTRRGAVVVQFSGTADPRSVPQGSGAVRDTLWAQNVGTAGTATLTAVSGRPAWAEVNAAGPVAGTAPVAVELVLTPGSLEEGHYAQDVVIGAAGDVWNQSAFSVVLRLHSPAARTLDTAVVALPGTMARSAAGVLVMASGMGLVKIDPATGAPTPWVGGLSNRVAGMAFAPDGALWVADGEMNRVVRVAPNGTWEQRYSGVGSGNDVAVLPDGTVFAAVGGALVRLAPGSMPRVDLAAANATALAYNPADGWLYYSSGTGPGLRRFNPATLANQTLGTAVPTGLRNLEVGRSGRLYGARNGDGGSIVVIERTGAVVGSLWPPSFGNGLAIGNGVMYGSGVAPGHQVWSMALADAPASARPGMAGDASGDGAITAQDALGVLASVVGRGVPDGWDVVIGGDANCDGQVTALDALIILSKVVGRDVSRYCIGTAR